MNKTRTIEITAQDIFSVKAALKAGAGRIELCAALDSAGLTPSIGLMERAVETAAEAGVVGFVDVLIRPREGDFIYGEDEIATAVLDVRRAVAAGVDGVVVGALDGEGKINCDYVKRVIDAAGGAHVVFHRAFDVAADQFESLEKLIELGVARVLTSGAAPVTGQGIERIGELVKCAAGRIEIMAGGGVRIGDIPKLFEVGVDAVHLSARRTVTGGANRPGENAGYSQVDESLVHAAVEASRDKKTLG